MPKRITIDNLAIIINSGFEDANKRTDDLRKEMNEGFEKVGNRLDRLDEGQEKVITRLDNLEEGQEKVITRLDNLEEGQEEIKSVMSQAVTKTDVKLLDRRVTKIEQKIGLV